MLFSNESDTTYTSNNFTIYQISSTQYCCGTSGPIFPQDIDENYTSCPVCGYDHKWSRRTWVKICKSSQAKSRGDENVAKSLFQVALRELSLPPPLHIDEYFSSMRTVWSRPAVPAVIHCGRMSRRPVPRRMKRENRSRYRRGIA